MAKILVVNGHPYEKSFMSEAFRFYINNIDTNKNELRSIDLGKFSFDPVLRFGYSKKMEKDQEIEYSQESIAWADHIVFFYPIWWSSMPGLFKGWFDRVFTPGFAYNVKGLSSEKLLQGKTAQIFVSCDAPAYYYRLLPGPIGLMKRNILAYCGVKLKKVDIIGKASHEKKAHARKKFLNLVVARAKGF